ncbi:MAG TPA: A-macroglobulin complement component [Gammaproteobacteria bacterium]|nr:A-macroglobulin complement component [Gammaproteobacteria bacterium]
MCIVYKRLVGLAVTVLALLMTTGATTGDISKMNDNAKVNAKSLGGNERYLMYVSTDRPVYRSGETLYARAIFLNAKDNTPYSGNTQESVEVKIRGPKGDTVFTGQARSSDSSAGIEWKIPEGSAGGEYTLVVNSLLLGIPQAQRSFDIRAYRAPRLKTQIEFMREGYGPGDTVKATVKVDRAEGGIPEGAKVTVVARVDGREVFKKSGYSVADDGTCSAEFNLPDVIDVGDASLSFIIEDGGVVETAVKTIPVLLQTLEISFYPEGGDLISGLESRVYIEANRPDGKPADIQGKIVKLINGKPTDTVAENVITVHEGRGVFSFAPDKNISKGQRYALIIDSPSGITKPFLLPEQKAKGAVLKSLKKVYQYNEKISLSVSSTKDSRVATVTLHKRELLIDSAKVAFSTEQPDNIELDPQGSEGVLIATLWSAEGEPLAERLVFREAKFSVNVQIKASDNTYVPGADVELEILTTDKNGKPVEAVVGVTITDDAVLEMIDKREQAPRLPVMVYLENEVKDLADAHVYLDAQNNRAPQAVDLLLGTQGWRRFVLSKYTEIKAAYPENARRILAEKTPAVIDNLRREGVFMQAAVLGMAEKEGDVFFDEMPVPAAVPVMEQNLPADEIMPDLAVHQEIEAVLEVKKEGKVMAPDRLMLRAKRRMARPRVPPAMFVREYAHQVRQNRKPNDRVDFAETLYWNAGIRTSARNGTAKIKFGLSDSVTAFRVMSDAFGRNGALGSNDYIINSVEPFYIEPKMPLQATVGDIIELPVVLVNASGDEIESANLLVRGEGPDIQQVDAVSLSPGERVRQIVRITPDRPGVYSLKFSAAAGVYTDTVTRELVVKASGFPIALNHGGLISSETEFNQKISIPQKIEPGSLIAQIKIYPSPLASMEEALNALLREPYGCFEQTSSSTYPLVMAQQYFVSHQGVSPKKIAEAKKLLDKGYKKLTGFESKDKGYEWFGASPAHEALTAYGLMEFVDMAKVMPVDEKMIERTRNWLLAKRDGKGGFKRNEKALDSFGGAPEKTTTAYIIWSLLESGEDAVKLQKEISAIKEEALKTDDSYVIALAANILYLSGDKQSATALSARLSKAVDTQGAIAGGVTSITRSGGDALAIETTGLALLAWLKDDEQWAAQVETSMKWLFERSKSGRFGSTQSTVLALKAINAYDAARAQPKQAGSVQLYIDNRAFGAPVKFTKGTKGAIELPDFSASLLPGEHSIVLKMTDGSKMPFALEVQYNTHLPVSSSTAQLKLSTKLSTSEINEGEPLEMQISVMAGSNDAPTPVAIVGIPAGLEVRHDQLKELVDAGRISAYEVIGSELVLYWRALKSQEKRVIPVTFTAAIPGTYTGPASRIYLYYTDEEKVWENAQSVTVLAR